MLYKYKVHKSATDQDKKVIYSWYMIVYSLVRLKMLMPYRSVDQHYEVFSNVKWIVLFVLEILGAAFFFAFERVKGSNTFACCLIDCICLISMFTIYKINEASSSQQPDNKVPLLKCLHL
jgi:L-asparagine transporter-like permease